MFKNVQIFILLVVLMYSVCDAISSVIVIVLVIVFVLQSRVTFFSKSFEN